jgi:addiction module HigA family antidote
MAMRTALISNNITEESFVTELTARRNPNRRPAHPGALLSEVVEATGLTRTDIALRLHISRQHLYDILEERKPVSANIAARLGKLFGNGGGVWLRMQAAHDLWEAERDASLNEIETLEVA